jgi:hypothetical protein
MTQELFETPVSFDLSARVAPPTPDIKPAKRGTRIKAPTSMILGGSLAERVAERAARMPVALGKTALAESVLGDVIDALRKFPHIKLSDILDDLRDLDPLYDGATVRRTIRRRLIELGEIKQRPKVNKSGSQSATSSVGLAAVVTTALPEVPTPNETGLDIASMVASLRADEFGA